MNENLTYNEALSALGACVAELIKKYLKSAKYTWEFKTKIIADKGNGIYTIKHCNIEYDAISVYRFDPGTMVRVIVPNNVFKDKYIIPYKKCKGFI